MKTILKYPLEITSNSQIINVPMCPRSKNFKDQFLKLDVQDGIPCLWCIVDPDAPCYSIQIKLVGTGHTDRIISKETYLGTITLSGGSFVYHVFYLHIVGCE